MSMVSYIQTWMSSFFFTVRLRLISLNTIYLYINIHPAINTKTNS